MGAEVWQRRAAAWVRRTVTVESKLDRLAALLRRSESGERGFLLTGDEQFLEPSIDFRQAIDAALEDLRDLVGDNPKQTGALDEIASLAKKRMDVLDARIRAAREGRTLEAVAMVRSLEGKKLMDKISAILDEMDREEERLFQEREQTYLSASEGLQLSLGLLSLLTAGSALVVMLNAQRQIHELKQAYERVVEESNLRLQAEAQLRQSQKLESLGRLAGGIAHDFNNLLAVIVTSLHILKRKTKGACDFEEIWHSAEQSAHKAARLIGRLLAFSREQPLDPKVLNPNEVIGGMSDILRMTLGAHVDVEFNLDDGLSRACIDAHELENAILNLAVNARDAMPRGGRLVISTEIAILDNQYRLQNPEVEPGQYVLISVTDTGEGIPLEIAARVFDPFFTTKPVGKGTGLGLSQIHGFVKQSNGHVKIYSEPGRGTTVKLLFPSFLGDISDSKDAESLLLGDEVLLVVDDDESARRMTALAAQELGYAVLEAADGPSALAALKSHPEISLLITDVVMPGVDGAALSREAVFRRHSLRVLYVTGYPRSFLLGRDLRRNAQVLSKPFALVQFAQAVRRALSTAQRSD